MCHRQRDFTNINTYLKAKQLEIIHVIFQIFIFHVYILALNKIYALVLLYVEKFSVLNWFKVDR